MTGFPDWVARIRADAESDSMPGATAADIAACEKELRITLPAIHRQLLLAFNGGEYRYGRLLGVTDTGRGFFTLADATGHTDVPLERYVPFADDYSGELYCFDRQTGNPDDPPVVRWGDDGKPEPVATSLLAFWEAAYTEDS